jgi:endonuclease III
VLATHILKQTGFYKQASDAIQRTADMVAKHYGRFIPHDKAAALAARILDQVWEAP